MESTPRTQDEQLHREVWGHGIGSLEQGLHGEVRDAVGVGRELGPRIFGFDATAESFRCRASYVKKIGWNELVGASGEARALSPAMRVPVTTRVVPGDSNGFMLLSDSVIGIHFARGSDVRVRGGYHPPR